MANYFVFNNALYGKELRHPSSKILVPTASQQQQQQQKQSAKTETLFFLFQNPPPSPHNINWCYSSLSPVSLLHPPTL